MARWERLGWRQRAGLALLGYGLRPTARKASLAAPAILSQGPNAARWMNADYETFSREGFLGNPYLYSAITQIARAFAGLPWKVYDSPAKKKEYDDHPLKTLLATPNPFMGGGAFWETYCAYLLIDGNTYVERAPAGGAPLELWPLRPDRIKIVPGDAKNLIAGYTYKVGGVEVAYPAELVSHLKRFNPLNDWYGASPIMAISKSVDQSNQSKAWNVALLQNGAQTSGTWVVQGALDPDQYNRIREQIEERYAGYINAGRPAVMEGGATWADQGLSPVDMSWEAGQKLSAREIAMGLNIAPELIGDPDSKTFSNYGEARKALYEENVLPFADVVADQFNGWLSPLYDGAIIAVDKDGVEALHENQDSVYTRNNSAFVAGWITINDARKAASLEEDPVYGDFYKWQVPTTAAFDTANGMYAIFDPETEERRDPNAQPALPYPMLPADHALNTGKLPELPPPTPPSGQPTADGKQPPESEPADGKPPAEPVAPAAKAILPFRREVAR